MLAIANPASPEARRQELVNELTLVERHLRYVMMVKVANKDTEASSPP